MDVTRRHFEEALGRKNTSTLLMFQVKLSHQESELVTLLKRLPLAEAELAVVREKAELLHQGQLKRGEAVLPIMLATFIFDVLCPRDSGSQAKQRATGKLCETTKEDEELGFKAALFALGTVQVSKICYLRFLLEFTAGFQTLVWGSRVATLKTQ